MQMESPSRFPARDVTLGVVSIVKERQIERKREIKNKLFSRLHAARRDRQPPQNFAFNCRRE
jgi:hypothetical protein